MTAPVILTIKKELNRTHTISERDARILLAYLNAQENRIKELETNTAPNSELLEACEGLLGFIKTFDMGGDWEQSNYPPIKKAKAIIAKAKGEQ